jgi:hypothetical protein
VRTFEASGGTKLGAWVLLGFWLLFAAFWVHECVDGAPSGAVWAWTAVSAAGLLLQVLRVVSVYRPLVELDEQVLRVRGVLGGTSRHALERVLGASMLQRRTKATLYLRFDVPGWLRSWRGRWLYSVDELDAPREFVAELLQRIPQAHVDPSVRRYMAGDEADSGPRWRQEPLR